MIRLTQCRQQSAYRHHQAKSRGQSSTVEGCTYVNRIKGNGCFSKNRTDGRPDATDVVVVKYCFSTIGGICHSSTARKGYVCHCISVRK